MDKENEIKIGEATYVVERSFSGKKTLKELLVERIVSEKKKEDAKSSVATRKSLCISINLLPREYRKPVKDFSWITDRRVVWPTLALIVAVISVVMLFSFIEETLSGLNQELDRVKAEV